MITSVSAISSEHWHKAGVRFATPPVHAGVEVLVALDIKGLCLCLRVEGRRRYAKPGKYA